MFFILFYIIKADKFGCTPLSFASQEGHVDVVRELAGHKNIDVNKVGHEQRKFEFSIAETFLFFCFLFSCSEIEFFVYFMLLTRRLITELRLCHRLAPQPALMSYLQTVKKKNNFDS